MDILKIDRSLRPTVEVAPLSDVDVLRGQAPVPPSVDGGAGLGGTVERIVRAPGDALRLLARDPVEAVAFAAAVLLLALACASVDRRRRLLLLTRGSLR